MDYPDVELLFVEFPPLELELLVAVFGFNAMAASISCWIGLSFDEVFPWEGFDAVPVFGELEFVDVFVDGVLDTVDPLPLLLELLPDDCEVCDPELVLDLLELDFALLTSLPGAPKSV